MLSKVIEFLESRPGYVKEGGERLSTILNSRGIETNPDECREAIRLVVYEQRRKERKIAKTLAPKILILDIETTPMEAYVWQTQVWKATVSDDQVISKWYMLTWSAKWLFSPEVMSMGLTGKEALKEDDTRLLKELWKLLDEADIVIAHNGDQFDIPNINTRFIIAGLPPTRPYQTIDTLKVSRSQFGFAHNSLNALAKQFGLDQKIETNFELWKRCKRGEDAALQEMERYNVHDTELLEDVYLKLRPWIKSHPNVGLYIETDHEVCPNCGGDHLTFIGHYYTQVGKYEALRCDCGAILRRRANVYPKEKRTSLTISIAK